jgi:surface antigen
MYLEGEISTLEMLASSKDLSEFVDQQQYRDSVQDKIKETLDKINALKVELKSKKDVVEGLLRDQQKMQGDLSASQAEQSRILSLNQAEQNSLDQQIRSNNSQIASLRAAQAAANARLGGRAEAGDPGHGGYPGYLDNAFQDSLIDPWGMYNRECVSYTAWKVFQTYGYMPYWGGHGNANQWPASARADGIATGSTPRAQSVAISMNGYYGHAMWVEGVSGNTIRVSQYNYDLAGHYSEMNISASGLVFIYFQ